MKVESPEFFHALQDKYAEREIKPNKITLDRNKAFHASFDTDEASAKDCFRLTNELYERIIEAYDQAILHEIEANTVVINGRKYGMLKGHPGLMPTLFGMRAETKIDMPDDWDFYLQERPPMVLTNYDKIRSMSEEELAQFFHDSVACDDCPVGDSKCKRAFALCKNTALAWLKSPVEVDNG